MAKKSDKVFHISVATFATVLAIISIGAIVATKDPALLNRLRGVNSVQTIGNTISEDSAGNETNIIQKVQEGLSNSTSKTAPPEKPSVKKPVTSEAFVQVKTYGTHVSTSSVQLVNRLLNDYHIERSVSDSLHLTLHKPVDIYLIGNQSDYASELASLGVSAKQVKQMTSDTGGFTEGSTIMVPMYQNRHDYDLANTLAHEMTHVFLNQNVDEIPSWMNEGLAVSDGMATQARVQNQVAFSGYARQMAQSVFAAAISGTLVPLSDDESKILQEDIPYDLELQDWLAVRDLMLTKGSRAFDTYFAQMNEDITDKDAFQSAFGMTEDAFNNQLTNALRTYEEQEDNGVQIEFRFPKSYKGNVRVLQHGLQTWGGFAPVSGTNRISILPSGAITGSGVKLIPSDFDQNAPDEATLYINIDPETPFTYQGQAVEDCGFAFDYHDGLYGFVNSWITLKNGHTVYSDVPELFGVQVSTVKERKVSLFLLEMIDPANT
jgi:hypothetical protein